MHCTSICSLGLRWFSRFRDKGVYVAVLAAISLCLDYFSAIAWSVFSNFTPVLLIHFLYEQMIKNGCINRWFARLTSEKLRERADKYGSWFVLFATPWIGVWVVTVTMKALKMNGNKLLLYSFISITVSAVAIAVNIAVGGGRSVDRSACISWIAGIGRRFLCRLDAGAQLVSNPFDSDSSNFICESPPYLVE